MPTYSYNKKKGQFEVDTNTPVSISDLSAIPVNTILGRISSGTGPVEELTSADVKTILNITGVTSSVVSALTSDVSTLFSTKQDNLVSGSNIKTINSTSLLGSSNILLQVPINFTTTGTSGAASFDGTNLNIPIYSGGGGGGLTNFTEALAASGINATIPIVSLAANNGATNVDIAIVPKALGAFTLAIADGTTVGGNKRGTKSVDLQMDRASADQVTNADFAGILSGLNNKIEATSDYSVILGGSGNTCQSGGFNIAAGQNNSCQGISCFSLGSYNVTSGDYSVTLGAGGLNYVKHKLVFGADSDGFGDGRAQKGTIILKGETTNAVLKILTSDGAAVNTNNIVRVSNDGGVAFDGLVVAKRQGSASVAAWNIRGCIQSNGGTVTLLGTSVNVISNTPAWTLTLTADSANGGMRVNFTGATGQNIRVTAFINTAETVYV
jgi:hypothetical protein